MAVVQVESGGRYFARVDTRDEPLIRFEGHYFYRLLPRAKRNRAVVAGLANSRAGRIRNPITQTGRWALLGKASRIDRPAALASVSWGVGQVMGVHWRWLGYGSIDALVGQVRSGLEGQVRLMARFIKKAGLVDKLAARDWAGFARAYNGPGYRRNKYDTRMARAYRIFADQGEDGNEVDEKQAKRHSMVLLRMGSRGNAVLELQNQLGTLGFHLARDGAFGPATEHAVKHFQKQSRLKADGIVGPKTFEMLMRKMPVHLH
ncbi:MAG: N-acetylmuramidase domain-containing protein [Rhizobiaceae bacterium]|nr:N-acetylmuramidase domain-containing protein [Rhizobiaceae bacterium]